MRFEQLQKLNNHIFSLNQNQLKQHFPFFLVCSILLCVVLRCIFNSANSSCLAILKAEMFSMKILLGQLSRNVWCIRGGGPSGLFKPHFYSYSPLKIHTPVQISNLATQVLKEELLLAVHCYAMCNVSKYTSQKLFPTQRKQNYNYLFEDWHCSESQPSQIICRAQHGHFFAEPELCTISYKWCACTNKLLDQT